MRVFCVHLPFRNGQFANIAVHFPLLSSKCCRRLTSRNSRAKNRIPGRSTHCVPGRKEDLSHMDAAQRAVRRRDFLAGVRDGVPIGLGYLAVAFRSALPPAARASTPFRGFLISLLNNASAGEYAAFTVIAADSGFERWRSSRSSPTRGTSDELLAQPEIFARHAFVPPAARRLRRTDELFGIAIARPGYLDPFYSYGAFVPAIPRLGHRHGAGRHGREHPAPRAWSARCPSRCSACFWRSSSRRRRKTRSCWAACA